MSNVAKWSKQTYETVAHVLLVNGANETERLTFANLFKADNPNFDRARFLLAAETAKGIRADIQVQVYQAYNDAAYVAYKADEEEPGYCYEDHA